MFTSTESELNALQQTRLTILTELRAWKGLMDLLADTFHTRYPPRGQWHGWTLHVIRCSKSKSCLMCPHAVVWRKYYLAKLSEAKKKSVLSEGKSLRKVAFIWGNKPSEICRSGLPPRLFLRPETRETFNKFEEFRSAIMVAHHELADAHKRLLLRIRKLEQRQKLSQAGPYLYKWLSLASEAADARASISRQIWSLRLDKSQGESRTVL